MSAVTPVFCVGCGEELLSTFRECPQCGGAVFAETRPDAVRRAEDGRSSISAAVAAPPKLLPLTEAPTAQRGRPTMRSPAGRKFCTNCGEELLPQLHECPTCSGTQFSDTRVPRGTGTAPRNDSVEQTGATQQTGVGVRGNLINVSVAQHFDASVSRPPVGHSVFVEETNFRLPALRPNQTLNPNQIRDRWESFYLGIIYLFDGIVALVLLGFLVTADIFTASVIVSVLGLLWLISWISWHLVKAFISGHSIEVGPAQYPQIYQTVKRASDLLKIPTPTVLICQGHGLFELLVARRFSRRGLIIITSNMMDEFSKRPSSRELMMFVGRQLGHIKARHFHLWILKDVIGGFAIFFHQAWKRRCNFTADRIGMLVAGELPAAERALYIITVGGGIAPSTNYDEVKEQRTRLFESPWSWIRLAFDSYPYIVDRIVRLREFSEEITANAPSDIGTVPVQYFPIRSLPLLIIHGHDLKAVYDLKDFLYGAFPHVVPRQMVSETFGALSMPEKFESTVMDAEGAIAMLTPDDSGAVARYRGAVATTRTPERDHGDWLGVGQTGQRTIFVAAPRRRRDPLRSLRSRRPSIRQLTTRVLGSG